MQKALNIFMDKDKCTHTHFIYKYKCNSKVKLHYARKSEQTCSPQRPCSEHYFSPLHPSCLDLKENYALCTIHPIQIHASTFGDTRQPSIRITKPVVRSKWSQYATRKVSKASTLTFLHSNYRIRFAGKLVNLLYWIYWLSLTRTTGYVLRGSLLISTRKVESTLLALLIQKYLLYWCKSTNTDAESALQTPWRRSRWMR
jgi:hypothetical protein